MALRPCPSLYAASGVFPAPHRLGSGAGAQGGILCGNRPCCPFPSTPASCCCCSVAQARLTLCHPVDCSTRGSHVLHHLPELAQTHVHCVGDAIQPSHPFPLPPGPGATTTHTKAPPSPQKHALPPGRESHVRDTVTASYIHISCNFQAASSNMEKRQRKKHLI